MSLTVHGLINMSPAPAIVSAGAAFPLQRSAPHAHPSGSGEEGGRGRVAFFIEVFSIMLGASRLFKCIGTPPHAVGYCWLYLSRPFCAVLTLILPKVEPLFCAVPVLPDLQAVLTLSVMPMMQNFLRKLLTVDLPALMVLPRRLEVAIPPSVTR